MKKIREFVAGIDIGAKKLFVSINNLLVKIFGTFTEDLESLGAYLVSHGIQTVAILKTDSFSVFISCLRRNDNCSFFLFLR